NPQHPQPKERPKEVDHKNRHRKKVKHRHDLSMISKILLFHFSSSAFTFDFSKPPLRNLHSRFRSEFVVSMCFFSRRFVSRFPIPCIQPFGQDSGPEIS